MASPIQIQVSKEMLNDLVAATKQIMLQYKLQNSDLIKSIEWVYRNDVFILIANDYFQYIDSGRRPRARRVPVQALIKWLQKKGIRPSLGMTYTSLAYAIREAIYKAGIRPRPYTQLIIGATIEMLSEELAVNLSVQIADVISEELTFTLGKN